MSTAATPAVSSDRKKLSDRAAGERKLGWKLAGPAFFIMLAVTAYPILQALWTSLFRYRLTDPSARRFTGLSNYLVTLTDPVFWQSIQVTVLITVITVIVELVFGFIIAMVMHRIVIPRRTLRTIVLIPYSIITVVSAFAWFYGFGVTSGFTNRWLNVLTFGAVPVDFDWSARFGLR